MLRCRASWRADSLGWALLALALLLTGCGRTDHAVHERAIPWSLGGAWLIADLHTHTRFSDGALQVPELATRAALNGCNVLAITDHSDSAAQSASPDFFDQVEQLRRKLPNLVILSGLEWNIPPYKGREHMGVIVAPQIERAILPQFKQMFDRSSAATNAEPAIRWLAAMVKNPEQHALIYHHPLRHSASNSEQVESDMGAWRALGASLIGFEGAPGHQKGKRIGAYGMTNPLQDRWDPVAARVDGVWDRLLARGVDLWGAIASSDYHNDGNDYEPCAFSQTVLQVPQRNAEGVLQALRAGTFWAGHGRVLRHLLLTVHAPGLVVPASPGESIRYRRGGAVELRVVVERYPSTRAGTLEVEVIGNCRAGTTQRIAAQEIASDHNSAEFSLSDLMPGADGRSCYVRARVRSSQAGEEGALFAYTNPIRIWLQ